MNHITLNKKGLGFLLAIFSAIAWGTNGTFCTVLSKLGLSELNIAILAPLINFTFFFFVLLFTNRKGFMVNRKMLLVLIVDGMMAGLVNISFVKSVIYFPVGIVSTLVFCNVFVVMILSRIVFKSKITLQKITAAIVAVSGVGLVLDVFSQGFHLNFTGLLWILFTILAWSCMVILEKYLLENGVDGSAVLMYMSLFAVLLISIYSPPYSLVSNILQISSRNSIVLLVILGYGLIPQVGSYFFYITGLRFIEPSYIQVAFSLDPVTAIILGYFIFGQTLALTQIFGILLILVVVAYIQFKENHEEISELDEKRSV